MFNNTRSVTNQQDASEKMFNDEKHLNKLIYNLVLNKAFLLP